MWPFKSEAPPVVVDSVVEIMREVSVAVLEKSPVPLPSTIALDQPELPADEMDEYIQAVDRLGIDCCAAVIEEKLRRCLQEEGICRYDTDQVIRYLDEHLGKTWVWRGLRTVDAKHLKNWSMNGHSRDVGFVGRPYSGTIPLPVLLTIEKVQKAVPEVFFYISAPKDDEGDPFLLVTSRHIGSYIIERWDEPNFRER